MNKAKKETNEKKGGKGKNTKKRCKVIKLKRGKIRRSEYIKINIVLKKASHRQKCNGTIIFPESRQ